MSQPITVEQALEIAFQHNPDILIALDTINRGKGQVAEARANFMPKFNGSISHVRQGPQISFVNPSTGQSISIVRDQDTIASATAFLPVDISRKLGYISDIAKYQLGIDYYGLLTVSEQLIFRVKFAYYEVLRAMGNEEVAQSAIDVTEAQLKDSRAKLAAGTAPKFDVTRLETQLANQNQTLLAAKNRVGVNRVVLNRVMGIDVTSPTAPIVSDIKVEQQQVDVAVRTQEAYDKRPEVQAAVTAIELNEKNVKLQRTGILPSLGVNGVVNYDARPTGFSTVNAGWTATVALSIPIWDGGVTAAKVDQAFADTQKSKDSLAQLKLTVGSEVGIAALNLDEATKRVATTQQGVDLAKESLRLAQVRYDAGYSPLVEVTDAQSALTLARFNLVQAQYDYVLAVAELQRATGSQPEMGQVEVICRIPPVYGGAK